jgi:dTMP kinase
VGRRQLTPTSELGGIVTRGRFITLEGGEGSGKSTQAERLASRLRKAGIDVVGTREPGGAAGAEEIRRLLVAGDTGRWQPMTEALLHYAARCEHAAQTIRPALRLGSWVVCDRFADSTMAYQGYGYRLGREIIERLHEMAVGPLTPDLTLILDLPVEIGFARIAGREGGEDRYERMDRAFHERLRAGFLDIARREPERCVVIDAARAVDDVAVAIAAAVTRRLGVTLG